MAIAGLYGLWGRRVVRDGRAAAWYAATIVLAFAAGSYVVGTVNYVLFAVCPMLFLILTLRKAIIAVVAANLVPILAGYVRGGQDYEFVTVYGPIFVMTTVVSAGFGLFITRVMGESRRTGRSSSPSWRAAAPRSPGSRTRPASPAERARLAGEIHDTLAQGFTSIITLLQAADPALRDERLALAVRTAKENLAESRALVAALAPSALAAGPARCGTPSGRRVSPRRPALPAAFRITGRAAALPTAVEVVLLRAAQEALTNVRRHAAAHEAAVLLAYAPRPVRLVVRDDGRGFDPAAADGFGLTGMRARAEQVGGTLAVRSDPGTGHDHRAGGARRDPDPAGRRSSGGAARAARHAGGRARPDRGRRGLLGRRGCRAAPSSCGPTSC